MSECTHLLPGRNITFMENEGNCPYCEIDRLKAELDKYSQGVKVYNVKVGKIYDNFEQITKGEIIIRLPSQFIGQRGTVIFMPKE